MTRLHGELKIGDRVYRRGETVPWKVIYPFFLVHMLMFGASGFFMAYNDEPAPVGFLFMHGGLAIFVYMAFYFTIFGRDEVKWMLINAALGVCYAKPCCTGRERKKTSKERESSTAAT
jgi:uncharacterized membrane protein